MPLSLRHNRQPISSNRRVDRWSNPVAVESLQNFWQIDDLLNQGEERFSVVAGLGALGPYLSVEAESRKQH